MFDKKTLLKNSIKSLKMYLKEMHDVMDSSKRKELEEIIKNLESSQEDYTPAQLLEILSRYICLIPAVIQIIEILSKK